MWEYLRVQTRSFQGRAHTHANAFTYNKTHLVSQTRTLMRAHVRMHAAG
jgi:hypothetical protein